MTIPSSKDFKQIDSWVRRFGGLLLQKKEVDGVFIMLFNEKTNRHLTYSQKIAYDMAMEIILQLLQDLGVNPDPYMTALAIELSKKSQATIPTAGGRGSA